MSLYGENPTFGEDGEIVDLRKRMRKLGAGACLTCDSNIIVTRREVNQIGGIEELRKAIQEGFDAAFIPIGENDSPDRIKIHVHEPLNTPVRRIAASVLTTAGLLAGFGQIADRDPEPFDNNDGRTSVVESDNSDLVVPETTPGENHKPEYDQIYPSYVR